MPVAALAGNEAAAALPTGVAAAAASAPVAVRATGAVRLGDGGTAPEPVISITPVGAAAITVAAVATNIDPTNLRILSISLYSVRVLPLPTVVCGPIPNRERRLRITGRGSPSVTAWSDLPEARVPSLIAHRGIRRAHPAVGIPLRV